MAITRLDGLATVTSGVGSATIPLGASWQPGDLRRVTLTASSSRSFSIPTSWTILHNSITGSRRITIVARTLQQGDTDAAVPMTATNGETTHNIATTAVTIRGANNASILASTPTVAPSPSNSRDVVAPTIATGDGLLLTEHYVTRVDQTANTGAWVGPDGMAVVASTLSDTNMGYNALVAAESRSSGDSGTRMARAGSAGAWTAVSHFLPAAATGGGSDTDVARNRLPNPTAANDVEGWLATGTPARATGLASPWARPTAARATVPAGGGAYSQFLGTPRVATAPGDAWSAICTVMASRAQQLQIGLVLRDANDGYVQGLANVFLDVAANVPQTVNLTGVIPAGATARVGIGLDMPQAAAGDVITLGSARLDDGTDPALPYRDGASTNWTWDGAAGSSTSRRLGSVEPGRMLLAV